jgi:hypothetical protein
LVTKPEGKRPLGRGVDRRILLKRIFREIEFRGVNLIYFAQDRGQWRAVVNMVMNLLVP